MSLRVRLVDLVVELVPRDPRPDTTGDQAAASLGAVAAVLEVFERAKCRAGARAALLELVDVELVAGKAAEVVAAYKPHGCTLEGAADVVRAAGRRIASGAARTVDDPLRELLDRGLAPRARA